MLVLNIELRYSLSSMPNYLTPHTRKQYKGKPSTLGTKKKEMLRMLDHLLNTTTKGKAVTGLSQEKRRILKLVLQGK